MASRRLLKFKPKPLVGNSQRRTREKEDLSESSSILSEPTSQEVKPTDVLTTITNSIGGETKSEHTTTEIAAAAQLLNLSSSAGNHFKNKSFKHEIAVCHEVAAENAKTTTESSNVTSSKCNLVERNETIPEASIQRVPVSIQSTKDTDTVQSLTNCKVGNISEDLLDTTLVSIDSSQSSDRNLSSVDSNVEATSEQILNTASKAIDPDKSSEPSGTSNTLKSAPKFGRSRCKPVLSNLAKRKKISPEENESMSINKLTPSVRTESVIKSVEAEISKANSPVVEMKDSVTSLETKEEDSPKHSISTKPNKDKPLDFNKVDSDVISKDSEIATSIKDDKHGNNDQRIQTVIVDKPTLNLNPTKSSSENSLENRDKTTLSSRVPMSPVRSTAKLVPKPSPRLSDVSTRRLSFQGSDSEEELKRKKPYLTNEPEVKKKTSDKTFKSNKRKQRSQGSTYSKMGQETLEKFSKKFGNSETPDKSQLKMIDLIFYNPKTNPMTRKPHTKSSVKKKEEEKINEHTEEDALAEQDVDNVEEAPALPVPQLTIGPDGQIMLDPKSLVIETTGTEKCRAELENSEVVQEFGQTRYTMYSKKRQPRSDWTPQETIQFYKALNTIGTDFSLMCQLFPKRTRHELKLKFKKEEKINLQLIDKAIKGPTEFNFESLEQDLRAEREEIARRKLEKQIEEEEVKRERALKREEKVKERQCKKKKKKLNLLDRTKRARYAAIKDFDEAEVGETFLNKGMYKPPVKKRKAKKKKETVKLESDSGEDLDFESESEEEGLKVVKMVKQVSSGRIIKPSTKLEEYKEMNETLRKKLKRNSDDEVEEDSYAFFPGAQMLFGEPMHSETEPLPTQALSEDITFQIPTVPSIEQTLMTKSNIEEVSEISELGSFGQNDSALDLSVPVRASITKEMLLNRQIISESIQIIDQLTENQETSEVVLGSESAMEDVHEVLPSFDTVDRTRSGVYSLQSSHQTDMQGPQEVLDEGNSNIVQIIHYNNSEECILGD